MIPKDSIEKFIRLEPGIISVEFVEGNEEIVKRCAGNNIPHDKLIIVIFKTCKENRQVYKFYDNIDQDQLDYMVRLIRLERKHNACYA